MNILAIDPGASGGLALLRKTGAKIDLVSALFMPVVEVAGDKKTLDFYKACDWLEQEEITIAVIEQVGAMPKQGVTSMFAFGRMVGSAEAFASWASFGRVVYVTPQKWKKAMFLGDIKSSSRFMASKLFGEDAGREYWPRAKDDGVAEAALLGYYYAQHMA